MPTKLFSLDIDLDRNILLNPKINPMSTISRQGLVLTVANAGYTSWDTNLNLLYIWTGTAWKTPGFENFIQLLDAPSSYVGNGLKLVRVNAAASGLEFYNITLTAGTGIVGGGDLSANRTFSLDLSYVNANYFLQGGNSFGVAANLGTIDANQLNLKTNNINRLYLDTTGKIASSSNSWSIDSLGNYSTGSSVFGPTVFTSKNQNFKVLASNPVFGDFTFANSAPINLNGDYTNLTITGNDLTTQLFFQVTGNVGQIQTAGTIDYMQFFSKSFRFGQPMYIGGTLAPTNTLHVGGTGRFTGTLQLDTIPALLTAATTVLTTNAGIVNSRTPAQLLGDINGVPATRLFTINGLAQDHSVDRTWTITTTGTLNRINVTGGAGLTPTIDIASTYIGQGSITTVGTLISGAIGAGFTAIPNSALAFSTISGIALGNTLPTLTIGTDLSGVSYNGSAAITIANTANLATTTGRGNATTTGISLTENGNLASSYSLYLKRNADISPLGWFIQAQNAAATANIFTVDINGNIFGNFNLGTAGNFLVVNNGTIVSRTSGQVAADLGATNFYIQNQTTQQLSANFNISGNGTIGQSATINGSLIGTGNITAAAWGVIGIRSTMSASSYTDNSTLGSTTVTNNVINSFGVPSLIASNTLVTYTNGINVYIAGAPVASTNVTITNPYALYVASGNSFFGGNISITGTYTGNLNTSLTFNNSGTGAASGTVFNNSSTQTISYNTIGASPAVATTFISQETPSGLINGTNTTFTLAFTPINAANGLSSLHLHKNGRLLKITNDYTLSGATITMVTAPVSPDTLLATYYK